jgi:hypothetical protein
MRINAVSPLTSLEISSFEFVFGKGLLGILWPDRGRRRDRTRFHRARQTHWPEGVAGTLTSRSPDSRHAFSGPESDLHYCERRIRAPGRGKYRRARDKYIRNCVTGQARSHDRRARIDAHASRSGRMAGCRWSARSDHPVSDRSTRRQGSWPEEKWIARTDAPATKPTEGCVRREPSCASPSAHRRAKLVSLLGEREA